MINEKTLRTLEFNKILAQLADHASFSAGRQHIHDLIPSTDLEEVRTWQSETAEAVAMIENEIAYSLGGARDIREEAMNATRGVVIDASDLLDIRYTMRRAGLIQRDLHKVRHEYPLLAEWGAEIDECADLQKDIARSIDDNGEVKDSASPRLAIIRRDLKQAFDRLQTKLNRIITSKTNLQYLQDNVITMRGGRYVVPLKMDYKGKIPGIIHDQSSSGATIFIEPLATVELNNEWRELQLEEEKEIRRILAALTDEVGRFSEHIVRAVEIMGYLDFTMSKARYAEKHGAVAPRMRAFDAKKSNPNHPGSTISLTSARHPLLTGEVVPIDVTFDDATYVLVITGPNTGGKTVALKTVGLLTLMAQAGLHVPAVAAEISVFDGIFADIGDEQSIEQSLSTFSSHMTNIISILQDCTPTSLVILDELGAGTDPAEGSALARALLDRLLKRHVTTMVSTHHPELKIYAVETSGVRNASVEFNLETLAPTYRLVVGLPGRSNALAIANRLGLDDSIINAARGLVATEDLVADDLLDEIQRTRKEITSKHDEVEVLRQEAQDLRDDLQARLDKIEDERRDILKVARQKSDEELEEVRKEIKRLQGDMRRVGMPMEQLEALKAAADKMTDWVAAPMDEDAVEPARETDWKPRVGDNVYLDTLNAEGTIMELDEKEALVQVGTLRVRAKYTDMRQRTRSERRAAKRGHKVVPKSTEPAPPMPDSPGMEIDLRGERVETALEKLDRYIDAAYLSGLPFGRIIHGKGTGKLREAIRNYLQHHSLVSKYTAADSKEGGAGVTIVHMASMN
ncbi:MAG: endonuclease MutS2 [Anaerolineaceae bacterium]|nr:endonuclease MutS2 [Anaerolineaceae bacterium]